MLAAWKHCWRAKRTMATIPYLTSCTLDKQDIRIAGHKIELPPLIFPNNGGRGFTRKQVRETTEAWYTHQVMPLVAEKLLQTNISQADREKALARLYETVSIRVKNQVTHKRIADGVAKAPPKRTAAPVPRAVPRKPPILLMQQKALDTSVHIINAAFELKEAQHTNKVPHYKDNLDLFTHLAFGLQTCGSSNRSKAIIGGIFENYPATKKHKLAISIWPDSFSSDKIRAKVDTYVDAYDRGDFGIKSEEVTACFALHFNQLRENDRGDDELDIIINKAEWETIDKTIEHLVLYHFLAILPIIPYIEKTSSTNMMLILEMYIRDLVIDPTLFSTAIDENALKSVIFNTIFKQKIAGIVNPNYPTQGISGIPAIFLSSPAAYDPAQFQKDFARLTPYLHTSPPVKGTKFLLEQLSERIVKPAGMKDSDIRKNLFMYYLNQFFTAKKVPASERSDGSWTSGLTKAVSGLFRRALPGVFPEPPPAVRLAARAK